MSAEIWYMDSDFCECGELLDDFGCCPDCGYEGGSCDEDEEDWFWDEDMYDENKAIVRKSSAEPHP